MSGNERRLFLLPAALAAALLATAAAADGEIAWTTRGPYVKQVNAVAIDSSDSATLYAAH